MTSAANAAAIILAAGRSERFGAQNKMLHEIDGVSIIRRTVSAVVDALLGDAVVVSGEDDDAILKACQGLDVRHAKNPTSWAGMGTSLATGAHAIRDDIDAVFIVLGDMPFLKTDTLTKMLTAFDPQSGRDIAVPVHNGRRGHPVLFGNEYLAQLRALNGDQGARRLLSDYPERVQAINVDDPGTLIDIDSPDDLETQIKSQ